MALREETKLSIKNSLKLIQEQKKQKVNHTDCDWIFDDIKDMIIDAVNNNVSLSDIAKCINSSTTFTSKEKKLKITGAKLAVWLKANNIARKIHKRKSKKKVKKDVKSA